MRLMLKTGQDHTQNLHQFCHGKKATCRPTIPRTKIEILIGDNDSSQRCQKTELYQDLPFSSKNRRNYHEK